MDHGAIPWVLVALDPGTQDPRFMLPWFMVHEPIPWVLVTLDPGTQDPRFMVHGSLVYSQE